MSLTVVASSIKQPGVSPRDTNRRSKEELELLREMDQSHNESASDNDKGEPKSKLAKRFVNI